MAASRARIKPSANCREELLFSDHEDGVNWEKYSIFLLTVGWIVP
jgi:hypothetical protein